jgi:hypothetical protein
MTTRRSAFADIGAKALALAAGILGFTTTAQASPFCCTLVYTSPPNGGQPCSSGCSTTCAQNEPYYTFLCWNCGPWQGKYYSCCECSSVPGEDTCYQANSDNTICSCYFGG